MLRPRIQFRLSTLLVAASISGVSAGVLRAFLGPEAKVVRVEITIVAGLAFLILGTKMAEVASGSVWPDLLSLVGFILTVAGLCVGAFYFLAWIGYS